MHVPYDHAMTDVILHGRAITDAVLHAHVVIVYAMQCHCVICSLSDRPVLQLKSSLWDFQGRLSDSNVISKTKSKIINSPDRQLFRQQQRIEENEEIRHRYCMPLIVEYQIY